MELKELLGQLQTSFAEFKTANDARLKAIESKGYAPADLEEKVNKLNDAVSAKEAEIASIKTAMQRTALPAAGTPEAKSDKDKKYEAAMKSYIRGGGGEMEMKALSSDSDQDGGYLVTPEMSTEIVKKIYETSPMRQFASVQVIGTNELTMLEDLDEAGAGWVGEVESRVATSSPTWKQISIPVHEIYAEPSATQRFLDDAAINVEMWLNEKVADKFARTENAAFVSGDGVKKPKGFLSYDAGTSFGQVEQVVSGGATSILPDSMINLIYSLKSAYKPNAKFFMKRGTIKEARKFKDSQNRYLWAPGMDGQTAGQILGYDIIEFNDMPDIAASSLSVVFGDMKQAYQIVDRIGVRVLRDPFTAKPYVKFYTTKRVGGGLKNFEAIKILKTST